MCLPACARISTADDDTVSTCVCVLQQVKGFAKATGGIRNRTKSKGSAVDELKKRTMLAICALASRVNNKPQQRYVDAEYKLRKEEMRNLQRRAVLMERHMARFPDSEREKNCGILDQPERREFEILELPVPDLSKPDTFHYVRVPQHEEMMGSVDEPLDDAVQDLADMISDPSDVNSITSAGALHRLSRDSSPEAVLVNTPTRSPPILSLREGPTRIVQHRKHIAPNSIPRLHPYRKW